VNLECTLDPTLQLLPNHTYTGRVTSGVNDGGLNPLPTFDLTFTTGADTLGPQLVDVFPFPDIPGIPVNTNFTIVFDEPVFGADTASVQVNGGAIAGTVTFPASTRVRFDPTQDLPAASTITLTLSSAITDASGNSITPLTFSFTTDS
jgi:hypothetical protein